MIEIGGGPRPRHHQGDRFQVFKSVRTFNVADFQGSTGDPKFAKLFQVQYILAQYTGQPSYFQQTPGRVDAGSLKQLTQDHISITFHTEQTK